MNTYPVANGQGHKHGTPGSIPAVGLAIGLAFFPASSLVKRSPAVRELKAMWCKGTCLCPMCIMMLKLPSMTKGLTNRLLKGHSKYLFDSGISFRGLVTFLNGVITTWNCKLQG